MVCYWDHLSLADSSICDADQFLCSGICRPESLKCDGADDCGDNSDEEGCGELMLLITHTT